MYRLMKQELLVGDSNGIKCGIVGEIGTCYPLDAFEKKSLKAAAFRFQVNIQVFLSPFILEETEELH